MSQGGHHESLATSWRLDNLVHSWMRGARMKTRAYKAEGHSFHYGRANQLLQGVLSMPILYGKCLGGFSFSYLHLVLHPND